MAPRVSIIIPAYNAEDTLSETLDSIAAQTSDAAREIIVVDDGSRDATAIVAIGHASEPRLIRTANFGAASALNTGIQAAGGAFLAFLDADDIWMPDKLAIQLAAIEADPALDFVLGHSEAFECPSYDAAAFAGLSYVKGATPGFLPSTFLVRREALTNRLGRFDTGLRTGFFIDWYRQAIAKGATWRMLDPVVHRRRIRPQTLGRRAAVSGNSADRLSSDFLEIARRALLQKRQNS